MSGVGAGGRRGPASFGGFDPAGSFSGGWGPGGRFHGRSVLPGEFARPLPAYPGDGGLGGPGGPLPDFGPPPRLPNDGSGGSEASGPTRPQPKGKAGGGRGGSRDQGKKEGDDNLDQAGSAWDLEEHLDTLGDMADSEDDRVPGEFEEDAADRSREARKERARREGTFADKAGAFIEGALGYVGDVALAVLDPSPAGEVKLAGRIGKRGAKALAGDVAGASVGRNGGNVRKGGAPAAGGSMSKAEQLAANQAQGRAGEDEVAKGLKGDVVRQPRTRFTDESGATSTRVHDFKENGELIEVKTGRQGLTKGNAKQTGKDRHIQAHPVETDSKGVRWEFREGKSGIGPNRSLQDELERSGIKFRVGGENKE